MRPTTKTIAFVRFWAGAEGEREQFKECEMVETDAVFEPNTKIVTATQSGFGSRLFAILGGIAFCFTGIGALVGIPLAIWGFFAPTHAKGVMRGTCPKCGLGLLIIKNVNAAKCPTFRVRVIVTGNKSQVLD